MTVAEAYATLGLRPGASHEEIRRAHREKARQSHPDMGGKPETFIRVQAAYEMLCESMGEQGEAPDMLILVELRAAIDLMLRDFRQEAIRQLVIVADAMDRFYARMARQARSLSRKQLARLGGYLRRK